MRLGLWLVPRRFFSQGVRFRSPSFIRHPAFKRLGSNPWIQTGVATTALGIGSYSFLQYSHQAFAQDQVSQDESPMVSLSKVEREIRKHGTVFDRVQQGSQAIVRLSRDIKTVCSIVLDYHLTLRQVADQDEATQKKERKKVHRRSAEKIRDLCFANGGLYVKFGQHVAQLDHILPIEYVDTMRACLAENPVCDYDQVCQVFLEDFGALPHEIFQSFEPQPFSSASLAQVHRAITKDGRKVAVKVQHRGLIESARVDIATIDLLLRTVRRLNPDVDYMWLVDEARVNLPRELDFLNEAKNAEKCAKVFSSWPNVAVPEIEKTICSERILTMEYMDGCHITELDQLEKMRISRHQVAQLLSESFGHMTFVEGWVHCDPHEKNVKVRPMKGEEDLDHPHPQLVLLDHGLYRDLDEDFRINYCKLIKSICLGDLEGIRHHSESMNAAHAWELFASILTATPFENVKQNRLEASVRPSMEDREEMQSYAQAHADEISGLLAKLPRPLLLILKTMDCLRAVERQLDTHVNSYTIMARYCQIGIDHTPFEMEKKSQLSLLHRISAWISSCKFSLGIYFYEWYLWFTWRPDRDHTDTS